VAEQPEVPDLERRAYLLGVLAELVARGGPAALLAPPVVPGPAAFPEPWQPTRGGVTALLRRLAWHAGQHRALVVIDEPRGALATERKPETHLELTEIREKEKEIVVTLSFIGEDDVVGTLAHEIGVAHALVSGLDTTAPYRVAESPVLAVDSDRDLERGSIATIYLGLGVLAANAAYQQYSRAGKLGGDYMPLEYDVLRAGYVPMSDLAYLLAVQAVIRGETSPPRGLSPPQRDEVSAWLAVLRDRKAELRDRLGVALDVQGVAARPHAVPFDDVEVGEAAPVGRRAFRWHMHRGLFGSAIGLAIAIGATIAISTAAPMFEPMVVCLIGGSVAGHLIGRRVRIARCSACVTMVPLRAERCSKCGATFHGDITSLSQRLEAEERLDEIDGGA
jgi:hypothetical protein